MLPRSWDEAPHRYKDNLAVGPADKLTKGMAMLPARHNGDDAWRNFLPSLLVEQADWSKRAEASLPERRYGATKELA